MDFMFPIPKVPKKRFALGSINFPPFLWSEITDKDVIGEGAYGTVLSASYKGKTVLVKKLLGHDENSHKLFLKEARFLQGIQSKYVAQFIAFCEEPVALMLEYVFFSFNPFGIQKKVNSLKDLLHVLHDQYDCHGFEQLPVFIARELTAAVHYLHSNGIAHRDLKTLNALVSNSHYCELEDPTVVKDILRRQPVYCKLVDFGESRSSQVQTKSVLQTRTSDIGRGTLLFMAPEMILGKITAASQEDLYLADIWSLGMIYFCLMNPDLSYPYQKEFEAAGTPLEEFLKQRMSMKKLPTISTEYLEEKATVWNPLKDLFNVCLEFEPQQRPTSKELTEKVDYLLKEPDNVQRREEEISKNKSVHSPTKLNETEQGCNIINRQDDQFIDEAIIQETRGSGLKKQRMSTKKLPTISTEYLEEKATVWNPLKDLFNVCLEIEPQQLPTSKELTDKVDYLWKEPDEVQRREEEISKNKSVHSPTKLNETEQGCNIINRQDDQFIDEAIIQEANGSGLNLSAAESDVPLPLHIREVKPASSQEPAEIYRNCPVFEAGRTSLYSSEEAARALLNPNINSKLACESIPTRVQRNVSFIVNINALNNQKDITADDNGSYKSGQGRINYVYCSSYDDCISSLTVTTEDRDVQLGEHKFLLTKYNGTCVSSKDFHRCIIRLKKPESLRFYQYAIIQYMFEGEEHDFPVSSHGNSKRYAPYKQTAHSIRDSLKCALEVNKPAEAVNVVKRQEGGHLSSTASGLLPRNYKQAENLKYSSHKNQCASNTFGDAKDVLGDVIERCKRTMNHPRKAFIWRVECAPEPMCIVGTENSFRDMERFCCNAPQGLHSTLTIDPTFDLGEFYFTPTTYKNLAVVHSNTGESKLQMGPALIHYRKKFSTYHYFTSSLVGVRPTLGQLKSFGTDGESSLISACEKTWPFADSLRCFIHSKKNVKSHLISYLPQVVAESFIDQIYGRKSGSHHTEGLCDIQDKETFEAVLNSLEDQWNTIESPYRGEKCKQPMFHEWFSTNVAHYMRECMLKNVRERNGISGIFTTNSSESINAAIKRKVDHKASEVGEFLIQMQQFYEDQEESVREAFAGEGDFKLSANYQQFELGEKYIMLQREQKVQHETSFYAMEFGVNPPSARPKVLHHGKEDEHIPGLTLKHSFFLLQKASQLMDKGLILPSFGKGCYHVMGSTQDAAPHYVRRIKEGEYKCDPDDPRNGCIAFKKDKICSHVVAAAKQTGEFASLVQKWKGKSNIVNVTAVAMHGITAGSGKKCGQGRKRKMASVETVTTAEELFNPPLKVKIVKHNGVHVAVEPGTKSFRVVFLEDHPMVVVCAGCGVKFPRCANGKPFGAPDNLVLGHLEQGSKRLPDGVLKVFQKKSMRYYHPNTQCVRKGNNGGNTAFSGSDVEYRESVARMEDSHKALLRRNLQLIFE